MNGDLFQSYKEQATKLAGQIAFLKMYSTRCAQDTARDAVQLFGGRGITQTGMGRFVEHVRSRFLIVCPFVRLVTDLSLLRLVSPDDHVRCDSRRR